MLSWIIAEIKEYDKQKLFTLSHFVHHYNLHKQTSLILLALNVIDKSKKLLSMSYRITAWQFNRK